MACCHWDSWLESWAVWQYWHFQIFSRFFSSEVFPHSNSLLFPILKPKSTNTVRDRSGVNYQWKEPHRNPAIILAWVHNRASIRISSLYSNQCLEYSPWTLHREDLELNVFNLDFKPIKNVCNESLTTNCCCQKEFTVPSSLLSIIAEDTAKKIIYHHRLINTLNINKKQIVTPKVLHSQKTKLYLVSLIAHISLLLVWFS